jgi:COMPASS component SPP1
MPLPAAITSLTGKGGAEREADGVSATASMKGKKATASKVCASSLSISVVVNLYSLKSAPKQKQPAKPRAKAASQAKAKPAVDGTGPALAAANKGSQSIPMPAPAIKKSVAAVGSASRSGSTSVMPSGIAVPEGDIEMAVVEPEKDPEAEEDGEDKEDDKLYCVCKTRYEEDRVIIACDRYVFDSYLLICY